MSWWIRVFLALWAPAALAQNPVQEVQQAAPHLVTMAGSPLNFQNLVQGLHQGRPVLLSTVLANGTAELATFTPAAPMPVAAVVNALEQAQLQLSALGLARPNASQLATALAGGILEHPNVQLGGVVPTHPASPGIRSQLVMVAVPSASAGGSQPAAPQFSLPPEVAAGIPPAMTPDVSIAPSPLVTPSPTPITVLPPPMPGGTFYVPPANVPGVR